MLYELLASNHADLVDRCQQKASRRHAPPTSEAELIRGIPLFLDQLINTLRIEQTAQRLQTGALAAASDGSAAAKSEMARAATVYGHSLLMQGCTVDQVVHAYGDVCQAVTDLACERTAAISSDEFRTLNRCLDNVIADAVTEYSRFYNDDAATRGVRIMNERVGSLAYALSDLLHTAMVAISAIKSGNVGLSGATGSVLDRCMIEMRDVLDRSIADVRATAGPRPRRKLVSLADFVGDVKLSATREAKASGCTFSVDEVSNDLAVDVDPDSLFAAVGNLLQNAFKFTKAATEVTLRAYGAEDRVYIDVEDNCGGLKPGAAERMFLPFAQHGQDRLELGLGLTICQRSVEANDGILRVKDVPTSGCIFTIDLPRHSLAKDSDSPSMDDGATPS